MEIKDKYELRRRKEPYSYEEELVKDELNIYEYFDGEKALWGVKEVKYNGTICRCTPPMEVITDENGKDIRRVYKLDNEEIIIRGKKDDFDVLYRVNISNKLESRFYKKEDFNGEDLIMQVVDYNMAFISYRDGIYKKCLYIGLNDFLPRSSVFDVINKRNFFLKSYYIREELLEGGCKDYVRTFAGLLENDGMTVKKYGWDLDKDKAIKFPFTQDGLIDEEEMKKYVRKTKSSYHSVDSYLQKLSFVDYLLAESSLRKENEKVYKK